MNLFKIFLLIIVTFILYYFAPEVGHIIRGEKVIVLTTTGQGFAFDKDNNKYWLDEDHIMPGEQLEVTINQYGEIIEGLE